jgi:arylsulfatase A-like enzyme
MQAAFTPSPVCSPARGSFWTGQLPSQHGIHDYIEEGGVGADHPGLRGQKNLADYLNQAGYRTGLIGKWHCGNPSEQPTGFDTWYTLSRGTSANFKQHFFHNGHEEIAEFGHQGPIITRHAQEFLDSNDERPFFLYLGYTDTHTPHSGAPQRLRDHYASAQFSDIPDESFAETHGADRLIPPADDQRRRAWLADYYASVSHIDEQVGAILDRLDNLGCRENTLVVYTSDHGHMNGHHGLWTKGNATIPQNVIDDSLMIPLVMRWPAGIAAGLQPHAMVDHCDLMATLLACAEANDGSYLGPGRSFLSLLQGENYTPKEIQFGEYGNARWARTNTAKFVQRFPGPNGQFPDEFYDLVTDPRERSNVLGNPDHSATAARLQQALAAHFSSWQTDDHRGDRIADQATHNTWQPWTVTPEEMRRRNTNI